MTKEGLKSAAFCNGIHSPFAAFTLLELLVVISIISMLMAISMPSLTKAREAGQRAVCLSNLKQLTLAWNAYAIENDGKICSADTNWNGAQPWDTTDYLAFVKNNYWVSDGPGTTYNEFCGTETAITRGVLWSYLEHPDVYKCLTDSTGYVRSYAMSHAMGSHWKIKNEENFYQMSEINMPSNKLVFMDVKLRLYRNLVGEMKDVGDDGSIYMINTFLKTWLTGIVKATDRHNRGTNLSLADGHIEYWKWKDPRTLELMSYIMDDDYGGEFKDNSHSINNPDLERFYPAIRGARDRQY